MKKRIILLIILILVLMYLSFFQMKQEKIYYTVMGNKYEFTNNLKSLNYTDLIMNDINKKNKLKKYSKDLIFFDIRITDFINKIEKNEKVNNNYIKNILNKTNLLLINIGSSELNYKFQNIEKYNSNDNEIYKYLDEMSNDINRLLFLIRKYSNTKIIFIGYYNETSNFLYNNYYLYINKKIKNNKNIIFIDVFDILKNKKSNYYLDDEENMLIYNKIMNKITCKKIY